MTEANSELQEFLHVREGRHRLFPKAALVGLVAGLVAVAFRSVLAFSDWARGELVAWAHAHPAGFLLPVLLGALGAGLSVLLVRRFAPEASGSGIPHLESVLRRHRTFRWRTVLAVKFIGGALAIGSGMVLGREGPTVQMGGAVGAGLSRLLKATTQERLTLIAAGAGAGLAAAFNAPLAGLVFVIEELQRDFRPTVFGAAFLAAAVADVVSRLASGQLPVFSAPSYPAPALGLLPIFAILGILAGILGVGFNKSLLRAQDLFARLNRRVGLLVPISVGGVVGAAAYFAPEFIGSGHGIGEAALGGKIALAAIPLIFVGRFALSMGSYATGAPGGIFAPLLALGALIGLGVGEAAKLALPTAAILPGAFAVVGMAAFFTAIVRAPLTGIVLIVEMTSSYALSLPLLVACFCAYGVAEATRNLPIYEALLQKDLARGTVPVTEPDEPIVIELEVEPGAPFAGRRVRELGLPSGVLLVSCRNGHDEWVPSAETVLPAHSRVTAVISHLAEDGAEAFRRGMGGQ